MNRARKWDVDDAAGMHVSDFRSAEPKFPASKAMGMNGDARPGTDFLFEFSEFDHLTNSMICFFDASTR